MMATMTATDLKAKIAAVEAEKRVTDSYAERRHLARMVRNLKDSLKLKEGGYEAMRHGR
jgi:hypothetical protein